MPQIQILTLFPDLFESFLRCGLMSRAVNQNIISITTTHLREFAVNTHGQVDDSPYGGGSGMVLRPDAGMKALRAARQNDPTAKVVLLTPRGKPLTQAMARRYSQSLAQQNGLIMLCTRYEGIDERIVEAEVDEEISIGDFIMMGGEIPAMAFLEATVRLLPGVLGNPESLVHESFEQELLEFPQYTKPAEIEGRSVPEVLLSGNHKLIDQWRNTKRKEDTAARRPDLIAGPIKPKADFTVALIHHPILDKQGATVTTSITNLDLHDIARSACTYGLSQYYVVHPVRALRRLSERILEHWDTGYGKIYNPNRSEALSLIRLVPEFQDVLLDIEARTGKLPKIITTCAKQHNRSITTFGEMRQKLMVSDEPHLFILGTGWGLTSEFINRADYHLEPVVGPTDYNHLSVRGAAAIMFDKLLGTQDPLPSFERA